MSADSTEWPATPYAWYVVAVLTVAYMVSFIDRVLLNLLVGPIQQSLSLTDTQISLLQGPAFALFFSVLGLPIAWLADRRSRRNIIAAGIVLWCVATALCGLADDFAELFAARILVGVGEAALSPAAYSIIADYFPPSRLARATGTYALGTYAGAGIAMLSGGIAISKLEGVGVLSVPLAGELQTWQLAFVVVGLPGLLVAALMFTVREPRRRGSTAAFSPARPGLRLHDLRAFLRIRRRPFLALCLGVSSVAMVMIALLSWTPTYLIRIYGWGVSEVGYRYGLVLLIFGTLGSVTGGWVADWARARGVLNAPTRVTIAAALAAIPFTMVLALPISSGLSLAAIAAATFLLASPVGLCAAAVQAMTPPNLRSQVTALYLLPVLLVGSGAGPVIVALFTEHVFADSLAIGKSLAAAAAVCIPVGAIALWRGFAKTSLDDQVGNAAAGSEA